MTPLSPKPLKSARRCPTQLKDPASNSSSICYNTKNVIAPHASYYRGFKHPCKNPGQHSTYHLLTALGMTTYTTTPLARISKLQPKEPMEATGSPGSPEASAVLPEAAPPWEDPAEKPRQRPLRLSGFFLRAYFNGLGRSQSKHTPLAR